MKDNRIVSSFDKVILPIDREDALLGRILREAENQRASLEKEQKMNIDHPHIQKIPSRSARKRRYRRKRRWPLAIAACLLLAITLIACIPKARASVLSWLGKVFSVQSYMGEQSSQRSPEPQMEAIIRPVESAEREIAITDVFDDDQARTMAKNFDIRLDEVAYANDTILITGWFPGTSGKFLLDPYTGGDTWHKKNEFTKGDMLLTLADGTVLYGVLNPYFTTEMDQLVSTARENDSGTPFDWIYDADGNLITSNPKADKLWYQYLEANDVRFTFEAPLAWQGEQPLSGQIEANLSFRQHYWDVNSKSDITLFRADLGTVSIDANAYAAGTTEYKIGQSVTLSGTHRMLITEWEYKSNSLNESGLATDSYLHQYVNEMDMSDVIITLESVAFTPSGPEVTLRLELPKSWTLAERIAAAGGRAAEALVGGLSYIVLIDGVEAKHVFSRFDTEADFPYIRPGNAQDGWPKNKDNPFFTVSGTFGGSTIPPSQWDTFETITFVPCTNWPSEMYVVEVGSENVLQQRTPMEPGVEVTMRVNFESAQPYDWQQDRLDEHAITIRLDDYR